MVLATTARGQTDCKELGKRRQEFAARAMDRAKRLSHAMSSLVGEVDFTKQASGKEQKNITVPFCGIVDPVLLSKKTPNNLKMMRVCGKGKGAM